jgi:hypothetical protein
MFTILRDAVSESSLKLIYYAYAQSQILYSIVIWGGSSYLEKVFVAQKRVLRAMSGLRYWRSNCALNSCRPLFASCGILTVYSLYILECMKFLVKHPEKSRRKNVMFQIQRALKLKLEKLNTVSMIYMLKSKSCCEYC